MSCIAEVKILMKYSDPVFQDLASWLTPTPPPFLKKKTTQKTQYLVITLTASTGEHGCT